MTELPSHKVRGVGNDRYGAERLALALRVVAGLDAAAVDWFIDGGTLLGAHRDGKLIPDDDDFDLAVYVPGFGGARDLRALERQVELPAPYATRIVTSYAQKIEVFDERSERFALPPPYQGADFHTVTVDVQIMTDAPDGSVVYLHDMLGDVRVPREAVVPTRHMLLEGHRFRCPRDRQRFLQAQYGYLGSDARYDAASKRYVQLP